MALMPNGTLSLPPISSGYGPRSGGAFSFHYGTDFVGYSQIRAILGGTVTFAGVLTAAAGNSVAVDSRDPLTGKTVTIVRMHMGAIHVRKGQVVGEGTVLGLMGSSGNATGPCDHVEIRYWSGSSFTTENPVTWLKARVGGSPAGGGTLAPDQRRAIAVTNGRAEPSSKSALVGDPLLAGAIGNFVGWIRGESVEGNNVWFKGTSGRWFWSGGFEGGAKTSGLPDLNAPSVGAHQRVVGPNGANGRTEATTSAAMTQTLPPGTVGDFNGWKRGEKVEGNDVWFRGAHSGDWFWSGGFDGGPNTAGLADLNPVTPPPLGDRRIAKFDLNGRSGPGTGYPVVGTLAAGTEGTFAEWTNGESVTLEGITSDVWFKGAVTGAWFAAAGFTTQSTSGLTRVNPPTPPAPVDTSDNPRGLTEYVPVLPFAQHGLIAPLGDGKRGEKGAPPNATPVEFVIDRFYLHWTGVLPDQLDYFSYKNDRSSCPTWFVRPDAECFELIRPKNKPASTGPEYNWRSVAVELQMVSGDKPITDAQIEWVCQTIAYIASMDGKTWDGVPVRFKIDRTHVVGHREVLPTACPGDYLMSKMDYIISRSKQIYAEKYAPEPEPDLSLNEQIKAKYSELGELIKQLED